MIIDYDHNPRLTYDQKLQSLKESVQMALNEAESGRLTLTEALNELSSQETKKALVNSIYPVGSIYISTNAASPADLFGGTWEQIEGKFLLGADLNYTAGSTGGEAAHTLTVNEMPSHRHKLSSGWQESGTDDRITYGAVSGDYYDVGYGNIPFMENVGGDGAHNNMPPYLSVYMWKRTA